MPSRKFLCGGLVLAAALMAPMLPHPAAAQYIAQPGYGYGYGAMPYGIQQPFGGGYSAFPNLTGPSGYGYGQAYGQSRPLPPQTTPQTGAPEAQWPPEGNRAGDQAARAAPAAGSAAAGAASSAAPTPAPGPAPEADNGPAVGSKFRGMGVALQGDIVSLSGTPFRLHGIQSPPIGSICGSGSTVWDCGQAAQGFLQGLLDRGRVVCTVVASGNPAEASCKLGRDDIGSAVVDAGMAQSGDPELSGRQFAAQLDGRGLWWGSPAENAARLRAATMRARGHSIEGVTGN